MARTYGEAADSETSYVVVHGTLDFDAAQMPVTDLSAQPPGPGGTTLPATISGKGLTKDGFETPFETSLTLAAECAGPWCAQAEPGVEVLAFVEKDGDSYRLVLGPCGGMVFQSPTPEDVTRVVACHQGKACDLKG